MHRYPDRHLISIITAVYNGEKHLEHTIQSVLGQIYPHIQYIIIDGGSTDKTVDIIKKYQDKLHFWSSEKDNGIYDAWNKGLAQATGEWVAFLGADDFLWNETVIQDVMPELSNAINHNIRYAYGKVNLLSLSGEQQITVWGQSWEESKKSIFRHMTVTHCGAFHHKSLFAEYGNFNSSFRITGDYEFLLREFSRGKDAFFINRVITGMRAGGISADLKLKLTVARENIKALSLNHIPVTFHHKMQIYKAYIANFLLKIIGINTFRKMSDLYRRLKGEDKIWSKIN